MNPCLFIRTGSISEECGYILVESVANGIQEMATGDPLGDSVVSSRRGFVPVKPFIFSDGEVLGEHAQACYYCVTLRWLIKVDYFLFADSQKEIR